MYALTQPTISRNIHVTDLPLGRPVNFWFASSLHRIIRAPQSSYGAVTFRFEADGVIAIETTPSLVTAAVRALAFRRES